MSRKRVGIAMNGVTGRMGYNQHLVRSILAIRKDGGIPLSDGTRLWPEPILVGRNERKLRDIAERHGLDNWTTSLDEALARDDVDIYFDSQITAAHVPAITAAIAAGKAIYTEKPIAESTE